MPGWVRRAFFSNLALKLLSLALAALLFVLVHSEKHAPAQGGVPVTYGIPPGKVLVTKPPAVLRVGVTGPVSRVQRFRFEDLGVITIELSGAKDGTFKFREELFPLPSGLKLAYIRPEGFHLRFEPSFRRELPVRLEVQGQPAEGFRVVSRTVRPLRVSISGPRKVVTALVALRTEPLGLDGTTVSVREKVRVVLPPGIQEADPESVDATVIVAPVPKPATKEE